MIWEGFYIMFKCTICTIGGTEYYLYFNVAASVEIEKRFKDKGISEILFKDKKVDLDNESVIAEILIEQGELARRFYGYDKGNFIKAEEIKQLIRPFEFAKLHGAVMYAVTLGYGKDEPGEKVVDIGLLELEKKKK